MFGKWVKFILVSWGVKMRLRKGVRRNSFLWLVLLAIAALTDRNGPPTLSGLDVSSDPKHTLVAMYRTDVSRSSVVWEGLASEKVMPGGYVFSVLPGTSLGDHPAALLSGSTTGCGQAPEKPGQEGR